LLYQLYPSPAPIPVLPPSWYLTAPPVLKNLKYPPSSCFLALLGLLFFFLFSTGLTVSVGLAVSAGLTCGSTSGYCKGLLSGTLGYVLAL